MLACSFHYSNHWKLNGYASRNINLLTSFGDRAMNVSRLFSFFPHYSSRFLIGILSEILRAYLVKWVSF